MPLSFPLKARDLSEACPSLDDGTVQSVTTAVNKAYGELIASSGDDDASEMWRKFHTEVLTPEIPFVVHKMLFQATYQNWDWEIGPAPAWFPSETEDLHISELMREKGLETYSQLHNWSIEHREAFWGDMVERLGVPYRSGDGILAGDTENPEWLPGAEINIADSCFNAPGDSVAVVHGQGSCDTLTTVTVDELRALSARVANSLVQNGSKPGDAIAVGAGPGTLMFDRSTCQ